MFTTDPFVITADMGYGHQRAVRPFRAIAHGGIIAAGDNDLATPSERRLWRRYLRLYEGFSRARSIPVVGKRLFAVLDRLLHIPSLYPMRNLSERTFQVDMLHREISRGLGEGIRRQLRTEWRPVLTSFYVPAIVADLDGHEPIYCIICDADLNRVWVARDPFESRITYFAPCGKAARRLQSYGVPQERIFLTGFPLDESLLGGRDLPVLKADLATRLRVLDPTGRFSVSHGPSVRHHLGDTFDCDVPTDRVLTIMYAVGGAGALKEIAVSLLKTFASRLRERTMRLRLVAGTRPEVRDYFVREIQRLDGIGESVDVIYADSVAEYFDAFDSAIHTTDVLWTKPSELSFYSGLGLPIIMTPPIGSQEKFNRKWLLEIGAGMRQEKPDHAGEWLFEMLDNGKFADMAWMGFLRARKMGTYNIRDVMSHGTFERSDHPLHR
ncbi:MAG TPA: hypothetical protein DIS79_10230 [Bacteroidetes bacterium]|nr:hypothetical protein [Bacteroidota bacterium]HRK04826.1 hypothetical protein [Chlorobiota bacterium]